MVIREQAAPRAAPARVWELVADPGLHGLWNPRVVATEAVSSGRPAAGFRYRVTYMLSGRRSSFDAEITGFEPERFWTARLEERDKGDGRHLERFMEEQFRLIPRGDRTQVLHEVRIHHPGIHPLQRLLIWIVMRTGRPQGQTFMERLAELAEEPDSRHVRAG